MVKKESPDSESQTLDKVIDYILCAEERNAEEYNLEIITGGKGESDLKSKL